MRNTPKSDTCPICCQEAPCCDYDEVDVGVGYIVGNESYECPFHGEFSYVFNDTSHTALTRTRKRYRDVCWRMKEADEEYEYLRSRVEHMRRQLGYEP